MDSCDESKADEENRLQSNPSHENVAESVNIDRRNSGEFASAEAQAVSVSEASNQPSVSLPNLPPDPRSSTSGAEQSLPVKESTSPNHSFKGIPKDMTDRERGLRNKSAKVERACSNAAHSSSAAGGSQSRNHMHQQSRHESETRNRPREKAQNPGRGPNVSNFERKAEPAMTEAASSKSLSESSIVEDEQESMAVEDAGSLSVDKSRLANLASEALIASGRIINCPSVTVIHNWQATKSTLKERLGFMYCNELMADVHFIVGKNGPKQRIPAHKFVLSIGSAVFDAMFNGGMATTDEEIELPDIEPAAFLCLLRFFYSDEVRIGPDTVMASLYAAKKYAVPALERGCVEYLKKHLSSDNAFMLLMQARLFDEPQLAAMCLEMIDKTTSEALVADGFTDIDLDTLCVVLERDTLGIKECKLFAAVTRWAEAECIRHGLRAVPENQRQVLGRALQLIRFPLMTVEEFAVGAAQSGILTDREVVELFLYFTVNPKPHVTFSDVLRCCLTGKEQVVSRFCEIENRWGYSGTSDRIRFMVNRKIFIVGFGLYGSIQSPAEYIVSIQIIQTDTGHVCGLNDTSFLSDGSTSTFRVMFKEPVEIQPNVSYTASATLKGPDSYYGAKGLRKVTHESITSGKVIFQFTYAAGNNNGTSVEDGQIPEIVFYTSDPVG